MQGGAANLVSIIQSFIGSGIVNRVIAVFDNDTAAKDALRGLQGVNIPTNIAVLRYPHIPYASNYPTIGPQGITSVDVNGLAGSLELYFGTDVLKDGSGEFVPVQWRGYNQALRQYQGEIVNKSSLQSAYFTKVDKCFQNEGEIASYDWSAMQSIFETIFNAFQMQ